MSEGLILIVDDEIPIQNALKRSFFRLPFKIFTASESKSAYEVLKNNNIDLIISDFKMPGEDGVQFLTKVKKDYPSTIRILISGFIDKDKLMQSLFRMNVVALFPKPWENRQLLNRVEELLQLKKLFPSKEIWQKINNPDLFKIKASS